MPHSGLVCNEEAHLLLGKWMEEQTALYMVLSVGVPPTSLRLNMPAVISELTPSLTIRHARGPAEGFLKCAWPDVLSFEYLEMRAEADKLSAYPGAPEFMRNRSILAIRARQDLLIRLVDLTLG
jgi:hypothetical protein